MAIACSCHGVRDRTVEDAIAAGARSVDHVMDLCGAGTNCGGCVPTIESLLEAAGACESAVSLSSSAA
ncbi:MAG: (2Fe-2S)-binding protein [Microthrixaceae bacterium]